MELIEKWFRRGFGFLLCGIVVFGGLGIIHEGHAGATESLFLHRYVGVQSCEVCHSSRLLGGQYQVWKSSPHSRAYADLSSSEAIDIGKRLGIPDPKNSQRCLSCHVTAPNATLPEVVSTFRMKDGVQCESCHGAGEDYTHYSVMIDHNKAKEAGLVSHPDKTTCISCHNPSSPTYRGFDEKSAMAQIAHPLSPGIREKFRKNHPEEGLHD
jgi:hypothetical protein